MSSWGQVAYLLGWGAEQSHWNILAWRLGAADWDGPKIALPPWEGTQSQICRVA